MDADTRLGARHAAPAGPAERADAAAPRGAGAQPARPSRHAVNRRQVEDALKMKVDVAIPDAAQGGRCEAVDRWANRRPRSRGGFRNGLLELAREDGDAASGEGWAPAGRRRPQTGALRAGAAVQPQAGATSARRRRTANVTDTGSAFGRRRPEATPQQVPDLPERELPPALSARRARWLSRIPVNCGRSVWPRSTRPCWPRWHRNA